MEAPLKNEARRSPLPLLRTSGIAFLAVGMMVACGPDFADRRASAADALPERWMPSLGEGLHRPGDLDLPPAIVQALAGVVRVGMDIRFRVTLYADRGDAATARGRPGARDKTFLADGGVEWPVHVDTASLSGLCANPIAAVQPGLGEVCGIDRGECTAFPCTRLSPQLAGSASGFVVGRDPEGRLLVVTAYHVVRETAERAGRTGGSPEVRPVDAPDLSVGFGEREGPDTRWMGDVRLLAHASEEGWREGRDWALLSVPAAPEVDERIQVLSLAQREPAPGDTVWTAGFPVVTRRERPADRPYPDAADELRISFGTVIPRSQATGPPAAGAPPVADPSAVRETDLLTTVDGASGSSGSPVLDLQGRVVGILRDSTCKEGELDLRIARYCGLTLVAPVALFRDAATSASSRVPEAADDRM